jgi:hypothetical protein
VHDGGRRQAGIVARGGDDVHHGASVLHRVIAQIDVSFPNSLIEAWWRSQTSVAVPATARQRRDREEARRALRE